MDRSRTLQRRVQIQAGVQEREEGAPGGGRRFQASTEDQEPFMGVKARRLTSLHRDYKGDYLDVPSDPFLLKILQKQGTHITSHAHMGDYTPLSLSLSHSFS